MNTETESSDPNVALYDRCVKSGRIDPNCSTCMEVFGTRDDPHAHAFAPGHTASRRCESGKRAHCTCDTCF